MEGNLYLACAAVRRFRRRVAVRLALFAALALLCPASGPAETAATARPLTIDDVLSIERIDAVALSPDGEWAAVAVQRGAGPGEVYGRTSYDLDPSRSDIWLVSRRTGERRNLTQGTEAAAGYWCPAWSPDGRYLAMLSTRPEGAEPRGGDNVRLYMWDRRRGALSRVSDAAMMTQTRTPLWRLDVRGGRDGSNAAQRCHEYENAPFAWIDDHRLIALMLPAGAVSGLIDEYARPLRHAGNTFASLRDGREATVAASGSGAERTTANEQALIRLINVPVGRIDTVAEVPTYPFRGDLTVSVSPDARRVALLATTGTIPPAAGRRIRSMDGNWEAEKQLGFAELAPGTGLRWVPLPMAARYPLELFDWSPDSRSVALRARSGAAETATPLFVASPAFLTVERVAPGLASVGGPRAGADSSHDGGALWADARHMVVQASGGGSARADWWLVAPGAEAVNLTRSLAQAPDAFRRMENKRLFALSSGRFMSLDLQRRRLEPLVSPALPQDASLVWPQDAGRRTTTAVVSDGDRLRAIPLGRSDGARSFATAPGADLLHIDPVRGFAVTREATRRGLLLRETELGGGATRNMMALDPGLAAIDWGQNLLIDYRSATGEVLKGAVILPPGYESGRRYPVLTWVYGGYVVRGLDDYFLDPYMGGFYNLYLYAARGYVVLIPSMPLSRGAASNDSLPSFAGNVLPAVDRLIDLGIADPERVGVFGQSFGGYSTYGLVTQTTRFRAAVAMAGIVDLARLYNIDPSARGYPGIEHEKSDNAFIAEVGRWRLGVPPWEAPELYARNSPLSFVDQIQTPLLMIHGEFDTRGPMSEAESLFTSLYRQGKTARLLRYWGESHGLSQSPANVRSIFEETARWFDRYLAPVTAASGAETQRQD